MTLLIALAAAFAVTIIWYISSKARALKVGLMCYTVYQSNDALIIDTANACRLQERHFYLKHLFH